MTRGERNIAWIEKHCRVPEGRLVGQPVRLREWQREILCEIYDSPTRRYICSFARKQGKTALASFLLLLHLCGPEAVKNGQLYSAAQSRDQASLLFGLAAKCVRQSPTLVKFVHVKDTARVLVCEGMGTVYRALSADATTAYGFSPSFIVHDELGQVKGPRSELYEALESACAAQENPLSIIISTQAPTNKDLLSVLIDDAAKGGDKRTKVRLYTAPQELDPFAVETIKLANPAYGDFQNAEEVLSEADAAKRMPSKESSYRNLILNQRVEQVALFCSARVWLDNGAEAAPFDSDTEVFCGLDLSETSDLTAFVMIGQVGGVWQVHPTFWLPEGMLAARAKEDRQPYDVWADQGFLQTTPGNSIEYEYVAAILRDLCDSYNVKKIAFDRYNWRHFRPWLERAGFEEEDLMTEGSVEEKSAALFFPFGQGFMSISPALRYLESNLLNNKLAHGAHPVLTMCCQNAVVMKDPAGNRKLSKQHSRGRIDGMVALAMAFGVAEVAEVEEEPSENGGLFIIG